MSFRKVYGWLTELPTSMYNGMTVEDLISGVHENEARQYLMKLILLNDRNRSNLHLITEKSHDFISSG